MKRVPRLWTSPDDVARAAVMTELRREVGSGHALAEHTREPVAIWSRCSRCAATSVRLHDSAFALVWMTWSGRQELPAQLRTTVLDDEDAAWEAMAVHAAQHDDSVSAGPAVQGVGSRDRGH